MNEVLLQGIPASPGIRIGKVCVLGREDFSVPKYSITKEQIPLEVSRFEDALIQTRREILDLQAQVAKGMGTGHAEIFDAHLLVLEDRMLIEEVISQVKKKELGIDFVFSEVLKKYAEVFSKMEDEYLKERISDINDVGRRILKHLLGKNQTKRELSQLKEPTIVVAHDLSPSDTASMFKKNIIGFITDVGGKTSHTAIMAKSLEIPAVIGLETATLQIHENEVVILDGNEGKVIVRPKQETLNKYQRKLEKIKELQKAYESMRGLPSVTVDGKSVHLAANIEFPEEIELVKEHNIGGIGLYRTEFFYMNRKDLPSENEQFEAYKYVAEQMKPYTVTIRTLDLGGDKFISQLQIPHEMKPFLGWRAIRFCLAQPAIFKAQLRAILRASAYGNLRIMYPMISGVEELRRANQVLEECKKELRSNKIAFNDKIPVGVMIEVPSAALTADILSREADFFSIGTNDLIQYALAVDRTDEKVAYLYDPAHPAVLRLLKSIVDAAHKENIPVGMCGEMSGDPLFTMLLIGLDLDELSMSASVTARIKQIIRTVATKQAKETLGQALDLSSGREVEKLMSERLHGILPKFYPKG